MMKIHTVLILSLLLASTPSAYPQQQLDAAAVIAKLIQHNGEREKLGGGYTGHRRYVLQNQRLNKRAEMVVSVKCGPEGTKHFDVVSEDGWKSANKHVIRKMLESETETSQPQVRPATSLTPQNYRFTLIGSDLLQGRRVYIIEVLPKREDKYLFEGRIWVDAEDFAVVRAEGKPARNPSFWTRSVHFVQQYQKSGAFWFPASTESVTEARIFGKTEVSISYFDYQPNFAADSCAATRSENGQIEVNYDDK